MSPDNMVLSESNPHYTRGVREVDFFFFFGGGGDRGFGSDTEITPLDCAVTKALVLHHTRQLDSSCLATPFNSHLPPVWMCDRC